MLANCQTYFRFHGKSSHAGAAPQKGRSALDALELMNVGINYLREHMEMTDRIHYAITNSGGVFPNSRFLSIRRRRKHILWAFGGS